MIRKNSDRFCRNPYFLHSICTTKAGLVGPYTESGSLHKGGRGASSSKAFSTYYAGGDNRTISEFRVRKKNKRSNNLTSKASDSNFGND